MMPLIAKAFRFFTAPVRLATVAVRGAIAELFYPYVYLERTEGAFPKVMKSQTLYVLTEDGTPWQAAMICPCGCGKTLDLNLLPDERPCWRFTADKRGRATLEPSVWRKIGCRSHFWLRGGRVIWV